MMPIIDLASGSYSSVGVRDYYGFEKGGNANLTRIVGIRCHREIFRDIYYNLYAIIHNEEIEEWELSWITGRPYYYV